MLENESPINLFNTESMNAQFRTLSYLFLLVAVALTHISCSNESHSKDNEGKDSTIAIPVEVSQVQEGDISAYYSSTATLEAEQQATVVSRVRGLVEQIYVEEGDMVQKGQVLVKLQDEQLEIEVKRALATLNKLENDYKRNKELFDKNLVSADEFENARFEYESQKAEYELAKLNLKNTEIVAPISGVVSSRMIKNGNLVTENQEVFEVTDFDPLLAILYVPEHEMNKIENNQKTLISVDARRGQTFEGEVERVSPVVDPETGTFKVTVAVQDQSDQLKPGMFGRVKVVYDVHKQTMLIPKQAVIEQDSEQSVYVVNENIALKKMINTGYVNGSNIEVTGGLDLNDRVVTIGQSSLQDSSLVEVIAM